MLKGGQRDALWTSVFTAACCISKMAVAEELSDDKHECKTGSCLFERLSNALADETPEEQLMADEWTSCRRLKKKLKFAQP